jgi:hypothetical protein
MLKSTMNRLQIHLRAHHCNLWPLFDVKLNDDFLHSGEVRDSLILSANLNGGPNILFMRHHSKRFGQGRMWDTISKDGQITQDRKIEIISISIDGIDFRDKLHKINFDQEPVPNEPSAPSYWDGCFNFNGSVSIIMDPSPLNWLINLRLKQDRNDNLSYFSDHTKLYHYEEDLALISEIESLLETMP